MQNKCAACGGGRIEAHRCTQCYYLNQYAREQMQLVECLRNH